MSSPARAEGYDTLAQQHDVSITPMVTVAKVSEMARTTVARSLFPTG